LRRRRHVVLRDPALGAAADEGRQVDAELPRLAPRARTGVDLLLRGHVLRDRFGDRGCTRLLREQRQQEVALRDRVPHLHQQPLDGAGGGGRDLHGRLVGLQDEQRVLGRHDVAGTDEQLCDRDVLELPEVGHANLDQRCHGGATSGSIW
jgi:hypothetical protein